LPAESQRGQVQINRIKKISTAAAPPPPSKKAKKSSAPEPPPPAAPGPAPEYTFFYHPQWKRDVDSLGETQLEKLEEVVKHIQQDPYNGEGAEHNHPINDVAVPPGAKCFARYFNHTDGDRVLFVVDQNKVYFLGLAIAHDYVKVTGRKFDACRTPEKLEERARDAAARPLSTRKPPPARPAPAGPADAPPPPAGPADDLPPLINRDPELPRRLHELGNRPVRTDIPIDMGNLGQFQIVHVPNDGNCLFTAIGLFVGMNQAGVRDKLNEHRPFGGYTEARFAAIAFERRVFIVNHFHGGDIPPYEGYDTNGNPIDMEQVAQGQVAPINPGQGQGDDIVLYFILNQDPNPGKGERHIEALVR
jgi:Txe/YoeB family toxin of Txe-Axe toxin-antitoxin module